MLLSTRDYHSLCRRYTGKTVKITDRSGKVHVGRISRVSGEKVYIEPLKSRRGYGYGFFGGGCGCGCGGGYGGGGGYYGGGGGYFYGGAYSLAIGFIAGIAIASLFFI